MTRLQPYVAGENRWLDRLATVANQAAAQLAIKGMPDVRYVPERSVSANCSLTMFFEKVVGALELEPRQQFDVI